MKKKPGKKKSFLQNALKLWVMVLIFSCLFLYLYVIKTSPERDRVPDEIILGAVLVLVAYVWIQEQRDRQRVEALNKALMAAQHQLEREEIDTIKTLILTEEAKDPYMRGHSKRVARYALALAREIGFPKERQKVIERAAILHDLGKLGIMDDILKKYEKLTDKEWKIIKKHPHRAVKILKPLRFLSEEKEIISHHHERHDGEGYPDGLKAEEIPLEARILAIADVFDALNSNRPYRKSLPRDMIISIFKKNSGSQFDPAMVSVFLKLLEKNPRLWKGK